ncbi:ATP-dependent helicase [Arthrobacter sp. CAU 1506]|uniref:ATP-dependent helicase n=1 Tax=Arthrobacter sp. CAU 1506 TaxID=2560052 RepID=UPI0010ABA18F|nr:ATP-dependent helicase [Arthrobacter sp. CAU 1506]TJY64126.1 ATP-dependent helicase [Arthrobacter sp. CAU 1506]
MSQFEDRHPEVSLSFLQRKAIESDSRAIVVLAGAGSGKTEVVARRVQRLLTQDGVGRILALSYTNKAAEELGERLRSRVGSESERVTTETIHGFAHSLLRQHSTKIGLPVEPEILTRDEDRAELLNQWLNSQGLQPATDPIAQLRDIDLNRARNIDTPAVEDWGRALASLPALDYAALLSAARELLELKSVRRQLGRTYTHIVVDEAQNLTPSQYLLLTALMGERGEGPAMMLVGDDKQSIISFAGADPDLIRQFARSYDAEVIELTDNFRSAAIISAVAGLIAGQLGQNQPSVEPHAAPGCIEYVSGSDESDEAAKISNWVEELLRSGLPEKSVAPGESVEIRAEDIAVIGRSVSALRGTAKALEARDVIYSTSSDAADWLEGLVGKVVLELIAFNAAARHVSPQWQLGRLIDVDPEMLKSREQIAAAIRSHDNVLIAALAKLVDETDIRGFIENLRTLVPDTEGSTSELASWNADVEEIEKAWRDYNATVDRESQTWGGFRLFCSRRQRGSATHGVQLLTVHKSQGREFRAVAIVGMNEGQIPDFRAKSPNEQAGELRTFYVAVTRARRVLLLSRALRRTTKYGQRPTTPSPYLAFARQLTDVRSK